MWSMIRPKLKQFYRHLKPLAPSQPAPPLASDAVDFLERKQAKLQRIVPLLRTDCPMIRDDRFFDFLTEELRQQFAIVDTDNVSSHGYDNIAEQMIIDYADGMILDCGAGLRPVYHDNVVNFEIVPYPTTDVRGVGEQLPFNDGVFDAAFSFAVLEHVRDPFACARELIRVLKPGGVLYAVVPFLQPYHGYPHHYYNMTQQGLTNLFADQLEVEMQEVNTGGKPIFSLTWVLQRWVESLPIEHRKSFLNMRVSDLIADPLTYVDQAFVTQLPEAANFELAAATSLIARKPLR